MLSSSREEHAFVLGEEKTCDRLKSRRLSTVRYLVNRFSLFYELEYDIGIIVVIGIQARGAAGDGV